MRETTLSELQRIAPAATKADEAFHMDQETFRGLYERTARPLWAYLFRRTHDAELAHDLLQETYYRFLRTRAVYESESCRKNYLFRIATNLVNDVHRQKQEHIELSEEHVAQPGKSANPDMQTAHRTDLSRAMAQLKPRQRDALWLAYAEGASHQEIALALGLKTSSVKLLLFRARRKLANLLRGERTVS